MTRWEANQDTAESYTYFGGVWYFEVGEPDWATGTFALSTVLSWVSLTFKLKVEKSHG